MKYQHTVKNTSRLSAAPLLVALTLCSCTRNQTTTNYDDPNATSDSLQAVATSQMQDELNKSKTIFYTLPSPVEMASIVKETGVKFDDQILSDLNRAGKYMTNLKTALNLGIYAADMSFAGMFNQSQSMITYMGTLKDMARKLGIVQVLDEDAMHKLENTDISKDEALNIISEVYMNTNQYLTDNNRRNISAVVMTGGWIEGLYLALNLVNPKKLNKMAVERIVSQKLTLGTVFNILDSMDPDGQDEDLTYIKGKMEQIKVVFDYIQLEKVGRISAVTDPDAKLTTIKANTASELDPDMFEALRLTVNQIRNEFVE